ncbi:MAG: response regulator transcription factor [Nitrospinae bacterium]|nr:response regulator transcription factor [Nitrospinota bacterium]
MRLKALLVEDDPFTLTLIARSLEDIGYEVYCHGSLTEAMTTLSMRRIDLAILEMADPSIPIKDFIKRAKALQENCCFVCLGDFLTAMDFISLQNAGAMEFWRKPGTAGEVESMISLLNHCGPGTH